MKDDRIDQLVREADLWGTRDARELPGDGERALLEEILASSVVDPTVLPRLRERRLVRRALTGAVVAAVVTVVAVVVPAVRGDVDAPSSRGEQTVAVGGGSDAIVYTAAAVAVAKSNPRLLIDEPGWSATTVYGFAKDTGTITFTKGDRDVEMNWYPSTAYRAYYADRNEVSARSQMVIDGQRGSRVTYERGDVAVMLEPEGDTFVEVRTAHFPSTAAALQVLERIRHVDVQTWLAALPPEVVVPGKAEGVVDEILADVPLPPGFDRGRLADLGVNDRYQLGVRVLDQVVCGWLAEWQRGLDGHDQAAAASARDALEGAHGWKILDEMQKTGGEYSEGPWQVADRARAGEGPLRLRESMGCPA